MIHTIKNAVEMDTKLEEADEKVVVVDFFAAWCGPCRMLSPKLEKCSEEIPEIIFLKVDVDDNSDLAQKYQIDVMPTIILIRKKEVVEKFIGSNYDKVLKVIKNTRNE